MPAFRTSLLACSGLLTLLLCVPVAGAQAESLGEAVETALNYHPSIEAARANRAAFGEEEAEKFSGYFPKLNATATAGRIYGDNATSRGLSVTRGAGYSWLGEGSVSVSQMLFDGFETARRVDAAGARVDSALFGLADVREDLALKTALAYLDVLRTRDALERIRAHHIKIADYRTRIMAMVDEGAADRSMDTQARDIQIQLEVTMADMEAQQRAAIAQYAEMTGHPPTDPMDKPVVRADLLPVDVADAVRYGQAHNPAIKAREMTGESLAYEARAEESTLYPDLNTELSYYKSDKDDVIGGEVVDARAVVKMNWNFSTGGAELARVRRAKYRHAESKAQALEVQRQIEREIAIAYSDMAKAEDQLRLQTEREDVSAALFDNYTDQFEGARINLLQLMQSDNAHFNARLAKMNAEYRLMAARFAALASMGRLQEALNIAPVATAQHRE